MKRALIVLIVGTVLSGLAAAYASAHNKPSSVQSPPDPN
jgi:hypothetical protein